MDKVFLAPVDDLAYAQEFLYRILPRRIGQECLLLNNVDLAALVAEKWPEDFETLRAALAAVDTYSDRKRVAPASGGKDRLRGKFPEPGHQE